MIMNSDLNAVNVLLIEGSAEYAALVVRWLSIESNKSEFVLTWTDSLEAALTRLKCGGIDLVLMDLGLPDSTGMETFTSVRSEVPNLPIIVLSGAENEALALQIIQTGAQDYLVKPKCSPEHLIRSLRHAMVRHQLVAGGGREQNAAKQTRLVGILGSTVGVGATTVACVLAAAFCV